MRRRFGRSQEESRNEEGSDQSARKVSGDCQFSLTIDCHFRGHQACLAEEENAKAAFRELEQRDTKVRADMKRLKEKAVQLEVDIKKESKKVRTISIHCYLQMRCLICITLQYSLINVDAQFCSCPNCARSRNER